MPTDTSAVPGRVLAPQSSDAQLLSAAAAVLAEQRACSHEAGFDALLDLARRSHVSVTTAAARVVSRPSAEPVGREPHRRATAHLTRRNDDGGVNG